MPTIKKIMSDNDDFLDKILLTQTQIIAKTLEELQAKLIDAAHAYTVGKKGVGGTPFALKHGATIRNEIAKIFEKEYSAKIKRMLRGYGKIDKWIEKTFNKLDLPINFTALDKEFFTSLVEQDFKIHRSFTVEAQNKVTQSIYNSVLIGTPFSQVVKDITGAITEHKDVLGKPLSQYSTTYANTSLMRYYRTVNTKKAEDAGVDTYLYFGNLMKESRPFCVGMVGGVFTKLEIKRIDQLTWQGKAGALMIDAGGWNCRHHWQPVRSDWIEEDELESFDAERKRAVKKADVKKKKLITETEKKIKGKTA